MIKLYWKPITKLKLKKGNFRCKVFDLRRFSKDPDLRITSLHDVKLISYKNAEADEGWYDFDITGKPLNGGH